MLIIIKVPLDRSVSHGRKASWPSSLQQMWIKDTATAPGAVGAVSKEKSQANIFKIETIKCLWEQCSSGVKTLVDLSIDKCFLGFERSDHYYTLYSQYVTIGMLCLQTAYWAVFLENDHENHVTLNLVWYREKIITPFVRDIRRFCLARNLPLYTQFFQKDGATCHTPRDLLHVNFENCNFQ